MTCMAQFGQIDLLEFELGFDRRALTLPRRARVRRTNTGTEATIQSGNAGPLWANPEFTVTPSKRQIEATPPKRKRFAGMDLDGKRTILLLRLTDGFDHGQRSNIESENVHQDRQFWIYPIS